MRIRNLIYLLIACYLGTFLRIFIGNNIVISILGSFFFGFFISKKLSKFNEFLLISGFFSCFTSFSGFLYFLYDVFIEADWIKFLFSLNLIIAINLFTMYLGFLVSRKIT